MQIDPIYIAVVIGVVLISMTFHEAMHGFMAYWLGDDTAKAEGRLTLNPLAHIDPFLTILLPIFLAIAGLPIFGGAKPVPFNPYRVRYGDFGAALVGIAGPLTNLVLAFISFGLYVLVEQPTGVLIGQGTSTVGMVLAISVMVNLGFFIFNMLPIPPLDGSRVLYALAPEGARKMMEIIEQYGIIFVFAIVLLFSRQLGQFMLAAIQFFIDVFSAIFGL